MDIREATKRNGTPFSRVEQLVEVLVFLFLIAPSMVLSLFVYQHEKATFGLVAWATILRDLALVALIFFFLWRNGEPARRIGWTFRGGWREILLGVALYVPFFYFTVGLELAFKTAGLTTPRSAPSFLLPKGAVEVALAFLLVIVVALSEETIFRGYLILRLGAITRSLVVATVLAAFVFSMGHGYEGSAGLATVGVMGIIFGAIFIWRESLVAPTVMHFIQDFIGIVLMPLIKQG